MRELRFRAWDKIEKKMWVPMIDVDGIPCARHPISQIANRMDGELLDPVMQYTGLKDMYEKEVYEGDYIRFSYGIPSIGVKAPVVYEDGAFYVLTKGHNPEKALLGDLEEMIGEFYVDGNIYEEGNVQS